MSTSSAQESSPARTCAKPSKTTAVGRHGLHGASLVTANSASFRICSTPAGHIAARNSATAEAADAAPRAGNSSLGPPLGDGEPALRLGAVPAERGEPSRGQGQRRQPLECVEPERMKPPPSRRAAAAALEHEHEWCDQARGVLRVVRGERVLDGRHSLAVAFKPRGRASMKRRQVERLSAQKL